MKAKVIIPILLVAGAIGAVAFYFLGPASATKDAVTVRTFTVKKGELVESASASGTIEPVRKVDVKSRASGEVTEVAVTEGHVVNEGDLLFRLDPTDADRDILKARATLDRLKAQLEQSKASLSIARLQANNAKADSALDKEGADLGLVTATSKRNTTNAARIASATVTQRTAEIAAMEAQIKAAELDVQVAERQLAYTKIIAPFAGTVLAVNVEKGTIVASGITNVSGGTAALTLGDLSDLRVVGKIDEAQIGKVIKGQTVKIRVDAYPERTFEGVVVEVAPLGLNVSNVVTFDVEIKVTDKEQKLLKPGLSADLEIITQKIDDALFVPLTAIVSKGPKRFVKLANGEEREVKTGATDGSRIVIREGLKEGDEVQAIGATVTKNPSGGPPGGGLVPGMGGGGSGRGGNRGPRM